MLWIIEDIEFMILVFIIVMILWLNCFEGNWNVRCPEENVCVCDSCRAGECLSSGVKKAHYVKSMIQQSYCDLKC